MTSAPLCGLMYSALWIVTKGGARSILLINSAKQAIRLYLKNVQHLANVRVATIVTDLITRVLWLMPISPMSAIISNIATPLAIAILPLNDAWSAQR